MYRYNVAVIGCGAVSKNHGKALRDNPLTNILYAVDTDMSKAEAFAAEYGGIPVTDYRSVYGRVDAAHIVTPHHTHAPIAIDLMEHGIHVFSEKPLAIEVEDARAMIRKSSETGIRLGVCFQNRMNRSSLMAREIVKSGKYGAVVSAMALVAWDRHGDYYAKSPWRGTYEKEGASCIINQSIHTLDLLDWLTGGVEKVSAQDAHLRTECTEYETEDSAMAYFHLKNGGRAVAFLSNCYPESKICTVELHLERAVLTVRQSGLTVEEKGGETLFHKAETLTGYKSEWGVSHGILIGEFYSSLSEGRSFICDGRTGLAAVEIVDAIKKSNGQYITLKGMEG